MNVNVLNAALLDAVIANHAARVRTLLEQGADPNFTEDPAGLTPLHFAAFYNSISVVSLLFVAGADPLRCDRELDTPLDLARRFGHHDMVLLLTRLSSIPALPAQVSGYAEDLA